MDASNPGPFHEVVATAQREESNRLGSDLVDDSMQDGGDSPISSAYISQRDRLSSEGSAVPAGTPTEGSGEIVSRNIHALDRVSTDEEVSSRTLRVVDDHYLFRSMSHQNRQDGVMVQQLDLRNSASTNASDTGIPGEKHYAVHPNCYGQLTLFYDDDIQDNDQVYSASEDEEQQDNRRIMLQQLVPPILQQINVSWEEYHTTMQFFQLRLLAWRGRRIIATMLIVTLGGEVFVLSFFRESGYVLIFGIFVIFMSIWITDYWLNAEMMVINQDTKLIFAAFKPHVLAVFTRASQWGGISPRYVLKFKPTRRSPEGQVDYLLHLRAQRIPVPRQDNIATSTETAEAPVMNPT